MTDPTCPMLVLPGAGGGPLDPDLLSDGSDPSQFVTIGYPGWQRYVEEGFSADVLIEFLAARIATSAPQGPIRLVGISIGGHFGYAAALRLQAMGREIGGFCAIDSFMIKSESPSAGWKGRILARCFDLLRKWRLSDFVTLARSLAWRALFRLAGNRLPDLLRRYGRSGRLPWILTLDPTFEEELSMRLLIRHTASWVASLDRAPIGLNAPAILFRTPATAADDAAWRRRCPDIEIVEIPGNHSSLLEKDHVGPLRQAFIAATQDWLTKRQELITQSL